MGRCCCAYRSGGRPPRAAPHLVPRPVGQGPQWLLDCSWSLAGQDGRATAVPDSPLGARQVTAGGNACSRHVGSAASEPVIQARDGGAACFGIATPERCRRTCSKLERDRLTHKLNAVARTLKGYLVDARRLTRPRPRRHPCCSRRRLMSGHRGGRYWNRTSDLLGVNEAL